MVNYYFRLYFRLVWQHVEDVLIFVDDDALRLNELAQATVAIVIILALFLLVMFELTRLGQRQCRTVFRHLHLDVARLLYHQLIGTILMKQRNFLWSSLDSMLVRPLFGLHGLILFLDLTDLLLWHLVDFHSLLGGFRETFGADFL